MKLLRKTKQEIAAIRTLDQPVLTGLDTGTVERSSPWPMLPRSVVVLAFVAVPG